MGEMKEIMLVDAGKVRELRKMALGMIAHLSLRSQGIGYMNCLEELGLWDGEGRNGKGGGK